MDDRQNTSRLPDRPGATCTTLVIDHPDGSSTFYAAAAEQSLDLLCEEFLDYLCRAAD